MILQFTPLNANSLNTKTDDHACQYNEFARLDGAVNLSVIANATPEEFALSRVYCTRIR